MQPTHHAAPALLDELRSLIARVDPVPEAVVRDALGAHPPGTATDGSPPSAGRG